MRNYLHFSRCFVFDRVFAGLLILMWIFVINVQLMSRVLPDKIKRFSESQFDTLISVEHSGKTIVVSNDASYTLVLQTRDSSPSIRSNVNLSFLAPEGKLLWKKFFPRLNFYQITPGGSSDPKIVTGYLVDEGQAVTEIYNLAGNRVSSVEDKVGLQASPNGTYFHTVAAMVVYNPLNVYDSTGRLLWSKRTPHDFWSVAPLSDSVLLYADGNELTALDGFTGTPRWQVSGSIYNRLIEPFGYLVPSDNGEYFIMHSREVLFSFSKRGDLLWKADYRQDSVILADVSLGINGRILGAVFVNKGARSERKLKFFDNVNGGKTISEYSFTLDAPIVGGPFGSLRLFDDIASLVVPSGTDVHYSKGIVPSSRTKLFLVDNSSNDSVTVEGIVNFAVPDSGDFLPRLMQTKIDRMKHVMILRTK